MAIAAELRRQLIETDNHRCAYCQTTEANTGLPMVFDHIIPQSQSGQTEFHNLCFACRRCNEFKGPSVRMLNPLTGENEIIVNVRRRWVGVGWHPSKS